MDCTSIDFDTLVQLHKEVKSFKTRTSAKTLGAFSDNTGHKPKFTRYNKTEKKNTSLNLSSTASCTYAFAEYSELWKNSEIFPSQNNLEDLQGYYEFIVDNLITEHSFSERVDEFSLLNILSLLKRIQPYIKDEILCDKDGKKVLDQDGKEILLIHKHSDEIFMIISELVQKFVKTPDPDSKDDPAADSENPHPYIQYRLLTILDDWRFEIEREKKGPKILSALYDKIYSEAKYELYRQCTFYLVHDESHFDIKRLVYSLLIVKRNSRYSNNLVTDYALKTIFDKQLGTGLLPIGHVVDNNFVLEPIGKNLDDGENFKLYEAKIIDGSVIARPQLSSFECFNDMLSDEHIKSDLKKYHEKFRLAFEWARERLRKTQSGEPLGWYPEYENTKKPESWVTSPILLFLKHYCSMLSELISENASDYLKAERIESQAILNTYHVKDSFVTIDDNIQSALLFGPSSQKSAVAKFWVSQLNEDQKNKHLKEQEWQYIELTPGLFLAQGTSKVIETANEIFKRLTRIKKAVVYFEDIDQLIENKGASSLEGSDEAVEKAKVKNEATWLTSTLLPKIANLRNEKNIRFVLGTNNLGNVDSEIFRDGRIDLVLPMGGIQWTERLDQLEKAIASIADPPTKDKLTKELFPVSFNAIKMKYAAEDDENRKNELFKAEIKKEPSFKELSCFLERTNFVSPFTTKRILGIFKEGDYNNITGNEIFSVFFLSGANYERFVEEDYSSFQDQLCRKDCKLCSHIRLPIKKHSNFAEKQLMEKTIIETNTF